MLPFERKKGKGVRVVTISELERGVNDPGFPLLLALADVLGVSLEAFRPDEAAKAEAGQKRPVGYPRGRPRKPSTETTSGEK